MGSVSGLYLDSARGGCILLYIRVVTGVDIDAAPAKHLQQGDSEL